MPDEPRAITPAYGRLDPPLPPLVDDIGIAIIEHGERTAELDPDHPEACLCGRFESYLFCDGPGVGDLTLSIDDNGRLHAD